MPYVCFINVLFALIFKLELLVNPDRILRLIRTKSTGVWVSSSLSTQAQLQLPWGNLDFWCVLNASLPISCMKKN